MCKLLMMITGLLAGLTFSAVDYSTLGNNTWVQLPLTGGVLSEGGDVHWACDTSGNAYIFGACTYGGQAGGTHNSDVYRFNLQSGAVTMLSNNANNRLGWTSTCQNGVAFDATRNCLWLGNNQGTFHKFQCPNGPLTTMQSGNNGNSYQGYLVYDNINDLIYVPSDYVLRIYNCKTNTWKTPVSYPFTQSVNWFTVPTCFDSKRGLFVITLAGPYTISNPATDIVMDVWFYNGATNQWSKKVPATRPEIYEQELAYDAVNDKYVYFGGDCPSQLWTYDYDSNTWTRVGQNSRAFNDANPLASTWPPARHKQAWAYSPTYNVCVNFGGGQWADATCTDYDYGTQPIWIYRVAKTGTGVDASTLRLMPRNALSIFPNPFSGRAEIRLPEASGLGSTQELKVYDMKGQLVYQMAPGNATSFVLNADQWPAGTYVARLMASQKKFEQRFMIMK